MKYILVIVSLFFYSCLFSQERINSTSSQIIKEFRKKHTISKDATKDYPVIVVDFDDSKVFYFLDSIQYKCFLTIVKPKTETKALSMMKEFNDKFKITERNKWIMPTRRRGDLLIELVDFEDIGYAYAISRKK